MQLSDAFIQSDLRHFISSCITWELNPLSWRC